MRSPYWPIGTPRASWTDYRRARRDGVVPGPFVVRSMPAFDFPPVGSPVKHVVLSGPPVGRSVYINIPIDPAPSPACAFTLTVDRRSQTDSP